jgi:hypothetical protein
MKTILTNRNKLFYDKYQYKVLVDLPGARYLKWKQNFDKFIKQLTERGYLDEHDCNDVVLLDFYKKVMDFYDEFKSNKEVTFLHDGILGVYTSNVDIIQKILKIDPTMKVYEAVTPPQKIMYFAKEPKYKYRVYLKSTRATESLIKSLDDFCKTYDNKGVYLSKGLVSFIYTSNWRKRFSSYIHSGFFIDFNDNSMLTFMHLIMGECLGKTYKLEKRP